MTALYRNVRCPMPHQERTHAETILQNDKTEWYKKNEKKKKSNK